MFEHLLDFIQINWGKAIRSITVDTEDIVAIGILILSLGAVLVAIITVVGLTYGKVTGGDATKIIISCVGGSTVMGAISALLHKKKSAPVKNATEPKGRRSK